MEPSLLPRPSLRPNTTLAISLVLLGLQPPLFAQTDPGPRPGAPTAGQPLSGLSAAQVAFFQEGLRRFQEVEDVSTNGLGPRFNSTSCSSCHAFPAVGGTSPKVNPQVNFANNHNALPPFISSTGPVRAARFINKPDGTPDGGVHSLFTIIGHAGTPSTCQLPQEDFSDAANISLRIPTPLFGLGLIEAISDATLEANLAANASQKAQLGISGTFNRNANDGTITRFGWKAQNKSLHIFAGEAYNVEMGITNLLFPNERDNTPGCSPVGGFNDKFNLTAAASASGTNYTQFDDVTTFAAFMRFLAPPAPAAFSVSAARGQALFTSIGCAACHSPTLLTGVSTFGPALSNQTIHPYSDFALHHMGPGLADHITQGLATGDEFRTTPLWGLGQRLFFLHDGRTNDLAKSINAHGAPPQAGGGPAAPPSEANASTALWNALSPSDKQALLTFLRSL